MGGHLQIAKVINFNLKLLCTYLYVYFCACTSDAASWTLGPLDLNSGPSQLLDWPHLPLCHLLQAPCRTQTSLLPHKDLLQGTQLYEGTSGVVANCVGCSQDPTSARALFSSSSSPQFTRDHLLASSHSTGALQQQLWRPGAQRTNSQDHWTPLSHRKPETDRRK